MSDRPCPVYKPQLFTGKVLNCRASGVIHLDVWLKSYRIRGDCPDMTIAVYCEIIYQQQQNKIKYSGVCSLSENGIYCNFHGCKT